MFKRMLIVPVLAAVGFVLVLSACGGSDLAEDLTPIPTLPPGEEPALVAPVESGAPDTADDTLSEDELIALGEKTFAASCSFCHTPEGGAGPAFNGLAGRAATRIEGLPAEEYIHQSIVDPGAYVVEGFSAMPPVAGQLSETEIDGLVAYILDQSGDGEMVAKTDESEPSEEPEAAPEETEEPETVPVGEADAAQGETLFAGNCAMCHGETDSPGPALTGMGERAAERVEGLSAEEYLHESIVDPSAYVVEDFADMMPKAYGTQLSEDDIANLIAYILTQ